MQIDTKKLKKIILTNLPYVIFAYAGNKLAFAYRTAEGAGFQEKLLPFLNNLGTAFADILPSFNVYDIVMGIIAAVVMRIVMYFKSRNKNSL